VIGARSAAFAPLKNLGLIVVDGRTRDNLQTGEAPRYHARDVRGRPRQDREVCGCSRKRDAIARELSQRHDRQYRLATLTQRIDEKQNALMRIVDLRQERRRKRPPRFYRKKLRAAIADRLEKREQQSYSEPPRLFHFASLQ